MARPRARNRRRVMKRTRQRFLCDALGFCLSVTVNLDNKNRLGSHKTWVNAKGLVRRSSRHEIRLQPGMDRGTAEIVVSHEIYHLFYSIRHLITADEETQAEVFGEFVGKTLEFYFYAP